MTEQTHSEAMGYFREVVVELTQIPLEQVRAHLELRLGEVEAKLIDLDIRTSANNQKLNRSITALSKAQGGIDELVLNLASVDERIAGHEAHSSDLRSAVDSIQRMLEVRAPSAAATTSGTAMDEAPQLTIGTVIEDLAAASWRQDSELRAVRSGVTEALEAARDSSGTAKSVAADLGTALASASRDQQASHAATETLIADLRATAARQERVTQVLLSVVIALLLLLGGLVFFVR